MSLTKVVNEGAKVNEPLPSQRPRCEVTGNEVLTQTSVISRQKISWGARGTSATVKKSSECMCVYITSTRTYL